MSTRSRAVLVEGDEIRFGDDEPWVVCNLREPQPCAVTLGPQQLVWGERNLLQLPSSDSPEASLFINVAGWCIDIGSELLHPSSGDIIRLPGAYYRVLLPEAPGTHDIGTASDELDLARLTLRFRTGPYGVSLALVQGLREVELGYRAPFATLLALARPRIATPQGGWVSGAELAEQRGSNSEKINVDIHRLRKLLNEAGVHNAAQVVERDEQKRLRIGTPKLKELRE